MLTKRLNNSIDLRHVFLVSILFLLSQARLMAQSDVNQLSKKEIAITIDSINRKLNKNYVFPEIATKMAGILNANLKNGKYSTLSNPSELASQLTNDLREVRIST